MLLFSSGTAGLFHRLKRGIFTLGNIVTLRDSVIVRILTCSEIDFRKELKEAQEGSRNAMAGIAQRYENRDGVEQNYEEAVRWYRMAVDKRHVTAMELLAKMYRDGRALSRVKYYADEGFFDAQKDLADMYYTGSGVKTDYAEAFNLYSKIAEQDDTGYSYYVLAQMHDKGQGREKILMRL